MVNWFLGLPTWGAVSVWAGAGVLACVVLVLVARSAWRSVDPPYEAVRRRPREMEPWHREPMPVVAPVVEVPRRSLDPEWREGILLSGMKAPARHRPEHLETETRAWDPEALKRATEGRRPPL